MKRWVPTQGKELAREDVQKIVDHVETMFGKMSAPQPRIVAIDHWDSPISDHVRYVILVEIGPGVVVSVEYGPLEGIALGIETEKRDDEWDVACCVSAAVESYIPIGVPALSDMLHGLRVLARRTLAKWSKKGIFVRLVDIRLAADESIGQRFPRFVMVLEYLDYRLQLNVDEFKVDPPRLLKAVLAKLLPSMASRYAAQATLAQQGADGSIDQFTLNVIARHANVEDTLRHFDARLPSKIKNWQVTLLMYDGNVSSFGADLATGLRWNPNSISVKGQVFPETVMIAYAGRPVTDFIEHPLLSSDMTIIEVSSKKEKLDDELSTIITFEQPRWMFCTRSGKVWSMKRPARRHRSRGVGQRILWLARSPSERAHDGERHAAERCPSHPDAAPGGVTGLLGCMPPCGRKGAVAAVAASSG